MSKKHNMMKYYDSAWKHDSSKSHILLATPYRYTKTSWYQPCSQSSSPPRLQPFIHGQFRPSQVQSHGLRGGFVEYYCHKVWELWNPLLQQESVLDQWKKFKLYIWVWIFARNLLLILSLLGHDDISKHRFHEIFVSFKIFAQAITYLYWAYVKIPTTASIRSESWFHRAFF